MGITHVELILHHDLPHSSHRKPSLAVWRRRGFAALGNTHRILKAVRRVFGSLEMLLIQPCFRGLLDCHRGIARCECVCGRSMREVMGERGSILCIDDSLRADKLDVCAIVGLSLREATSSPFCSDRTRVLVNNLPAETFRNLQVTG
jgi:hypothetical protein